MKNLILVASLLAVAGPAMAVDVGVAINIGQPNFYGRIDIGNYPPPRVIYEQPIIIERPRHYVEQRPIYLRVPPGHQKKWSKHCRAYGACGQRVYFVQDAWYRDDYAPRYRAQHDDRHEQRQEDRRDDRWDKQADKRDDKWEKHAEKREEKRDKREEKRDKHDERGNGGRD